MTGKDNVLYYIQRCPRLYTLLYFLLFATYYLQFDTNMYNLLGKECSTTRSVGSITSHRVSIGTMMQTDVLRHFLR